MQVVWMKYQSGEWCRLTSLNLNDDHFNDLRGVYIIWSGTKVVRLGSGIIKDRLEYHRNNKEILAYPNLLVTWAKVNANQMEGVEKFLADTFNPAIGERFPDRTPIVVNLPSLY